MELDLQPYTTHEILLTYEFIFAQWIGGETALNDTDKKVPTVYIFERLVKELRDKYSIRKDAIWKS